MVQLVVLNELLPAVFKLLMQDKRPGAPSVEIEYAQLRAKTTLGFLEDMLTDSQYFAGDQLTLAEIVAGTIVHKLPGLGVSLVGYPRLKRWSEQLLARPTWQQIELSAEE
ncbi:MAG: glutathione S-transferase family protein [Leptolyngbya sp. DLM2.Bin27]|nr:MAG: glutathione S-transferase family protein [Leptolyngbya sp. DLM2.Bin27]